MEYGEHLTLKEAAVFAEVSEGTMRTWAKEIPNIKRYPGGGYGIPRNDLMAYLGSKQWRKSGATKGVQAEGRVQTESENIPPYLLQLLEEIKGEREGLREELTFTRERVRDLEARNRELESDLVSLTREMRELIYGNGKPGLSAWMTKVQADEEPKARQAIVVDAHVENEKANGRKHEQAAATERTTKTRTKIPVKKANSKLKPKASKKKTAFKSSKKKK